MTDTAAVILAGGRGSRLGGVDKPMLTLAGRTLLARTLAAAASAGCAPLIVVGPRRPGHDGVTWVREDPAFGGPAAAVAAALPVVRSEWMLLLAADLVHPGRVVETVMSARRRSDGALLLDAEGKRQWLAGVYRTDALRRQVRALDESLVGARASALLADLDLAPVAVTASGAERENPDDLSRDVDTWDHLQQARAALAPRKEDTVTEGTSRTLPPEALDAWAAELRQQFDLAEDDLPIALILDLARDVANGVARPAAPFSAYVAGLVAGRAGGSPERVRETVAAITSLAREWEQR